MGVGNEYGHSLAALSCIHLEIIRVHLEIIRVHLHKSHAGYKCG